MQSDDVEVADVWSGASSDLEQEAPESRETKKRRREDDIVTGGAGAPADDDNEEDEEDDDTAVGGADLGEAIPKQPLIELLIPMLWRMLPLETVSHSITRLTKSAPKKETTSSITEKGPGASIVEAACSSTGEAHAVKAPVSDADQLVDFSQHCMMQHDFAALSVTREALLRKTKLEANRPGQLLAIPAMWILKWVSDPTQQIHGPFTSEQIAKWHQGGFFAKKRAIISDANDLTNPRRWDDAASCSTSLR